jgi:hypothetical protein
VIAFVRLLVAFPFYVIAAGALWAAEKIDGEGL